MGTPALFLLGAVIVLYANAIERTRGKDQLICTGSTFYKVSKDGRARCKECPSCTGGGIGWNTTEKRLEDEHGFRSCYKCVKCKPGTYRELESRDSECLPCGLDCNIKKRYGSVRCGGASPGHCGECWTGYQANSKEPNSMCTLKPTEVAVEPSTRSILTTIGDMAKEETKGHNPIANVPIWIPAGILLLLTLSLLACAVFAAKCHKRNNDDRNAQSSASGSKRALLNSGSSVGDDDLYIDGPTNGHVRAELPEEVTTIGQYEAMRFRQQSLDSKPHGTLVFNDRILTIGDETITVVSLNVHGERRHELFQTYLKIEKSKTSPEMEKWQSKICSFPDYILEVLKIWLQTANKGATLKALCVALELASYHDIVEKVLGLEENQPVFKEDLNDCIV